MWSHAVLCPGFAYGGMKGCRPALQVTKPQARKGFRSVAQVFIEWPGVTNLCLHILLWLKTLQTLKKPYSPKTVTAVCRSTSMHAAENRGCFCLGTIVGLFVRLSIDMYGRREAKHPTCLIYESNCII